MEQPKQLNIECTLGALFLPELGSIRSVLSKVRMQENNPTSNFSTNYENYANSAYSKNFKTISKGPGGTIPRLNLTIGAPRATFVDGAIAPGEIHPVYNLIKAPKESKLTGFAYSIDPLAQSIPLNSVSGISYSEGFNNNYDYFNLGSSGYVPLAKGEISYENAVKTTYNIWKQPTNNDQGKKYLIGLGVTNYESLGSPHIESPSGPNIPGIVINAANSACLLERIFPMADDLLYADTESGSRPLIWYTKSGGGNPFSKKILARGGKNCGFWLRFQNLSDFGIYRSGNSSKKSSIRFAFGDFSKIDVNKITQFAVIISDTSSVLRYLNPRTKEWISVNLSNRAIFSSGSLDIFVHFAGPNMFIGFDKEISTWNVIDPISLDSNTDDVFNPEIDLKSTIQVFVENFNCVFTYSPICFDSFDPELVANSLSGTTYTNPEGNCTVNVLLDVSKNDSTAVDSVKETNLNKNFLDKKFIQYQTYNLEKKIEDMPTFYSDWRRINAINYTDANKFLTSNEYAAQPELKYFEISRTESELKPGDPRIRVKGVVRYETTIEGPVFFYVRNYKDDEIQETSPRMVKEIWGKHSDISKYFSSAKVTESFNFLNFSYKKTTADITLINLTNDQIGRQILNALQENILVITLKCGYDNDDKKIYFQGIITNLTVSRSSDQFNVTLKCEDLGSFLLENIRFPETSPFPIGMRTFGRVLEDTFEFAGLKMYYKPRPRIGNFDIIYDIYFNRAQGIMVSQNALTSKSLSINVEQTVFNVLEKILPNFTYANNSTGLFINSLPVFRWDAESETFILSLRKDEDPEKIWLVGKPSDEQLLANSNKIDDKPSLHGVAIGDQAWTETTDLNSLFSEVWLRFQRWDGLSFMEVSNASYVNRAVSQDSFDKLKDLIQEGPSSEFSQPNLGYIGFNKILWRDYFGNNNFKTSKLAKLQLLQEEYKSRYTIQKLNLNVYVTRPLQSHYKFTVDSFEDSGVIDYSGEYIFSSVTYDISAEVNLIKASIEGQYLPSSD